MKGATLFVVGALCAALTVPLYAHDPERMAAAICTAWWVALTFALGALGAVMTLVLSRATWFVFFRPITTSIAAAMPVLALGLLPAAFVAPRVYSWAGADPGLPTAILERIEPARTWMSPVPVHVRTLVSLGLWSTLALALHTRGANRRSRVVSAIGLPVLAITATVTPFDWMMAVEPGWTSTIYGMYILVSGFYGAVGLVAVCAPFALRRSDVRPDHVHAHGRIMLTAVCLWAYLAFFQFMLQWIGNVPAEVQFFARRAEGPWGLVSFGLVLVHFVVPFFLLLSRPLKRSIDALAMVGALMVIGHIADVTWLVLPSRTPTAFASALVPLLAALGLGGGWALRRYPSPATRHDPDDLRGARYESP